MNEIGKSVLKLIVTVVGVDALLYLSEFQLRPAIAGLRAGKIVAESEAPKPLQDVSKAVAHALHLTAVRVVDAPGDGLSAHASLEKNPPEVAMNVRGFDTADAVVVKAVIAHEYGHIKRAVEGNTTNVALYLLPNCLLMTCAIWSFWCISKSSNKTLLIVFVIIISSLWIGTNRDVNILVSTCAAILAAILPITVLNKTDRRRYQLPLFVALLLYGAGVGIRNHYFREDETYADAVAKSVVGADGLAQMLCALSAEAERSKNYIWGPYYTYQELQDLHPTASRRAEAAGVQLHCSA